ncbi:MAG: ArnT family glycosyltransferase [Dehalococcoidia bacterium]
MPFNRDGWLPLVRTAGPPDAGVRPVRKGAATRGAAGDHGDARPRRWTRGPIAAVAVATLYVMLLAPLLRFGIDDLGIAAVFSTDEALSGRIVRAMIENRTLNPQHFFAYGAFYHELAALPLMPFAWLGAGDRAALLSLRFVALVSGGATVLLTAWLGARLYGWPAGVLAAALLAASPELARWSITAHPDTLQLALITGGLIAVVSVRERPSPGRIAVAAVLAGMAFGTKYGGLFLLPLILLAAWCALVEQGRRGAPLLQQFALQLALVAMAFAAAFVVTNPYAAIEWRRFLTQFEAEIQHARAGHVFAGTAGWWNWIEIVASPKGAGVVTFAVALAGWVRLGWDRARMWRAPMTPWWRRVATLLDARALIALWTAGYLAYLIGFVGLHEPRYALPALPGLAVSAAGFVVFVLRGASQRTALVAGALVIACAVLPAAIPLRDVYATRTAQRADGGNPRIAAGRWLAEHVPAEASILADAYVYVPPVFSHHAETFGLTAEQIDAVRPVVIVTNEDIRGRFRDVERAERYVDGAAVFHRRADAYARLEAGQVRCYRLLQDFGSVRVYADEEALRDGKQRGCGTET